MSGRDRSPVNRLVGAFVNPVVESVDLDDVLGNVDLNELIERVDLNRALDRVDIDRLLRRVDIDGLLDRVDIDALMDRVDIDKILKKTSVGNVVTDSASTMAMSALDLGRSQAVGLDAVIGRVGDKVLRRKVPTTGRPGELTGRPATGATRLASYALDAVIVAVGFSLTVSITVYLMNLFLSKQIEASNADGKWWLGLTALFSGLYLWGSWGIAGRTPGEAVLGLRVVNWEHGRLSVRAALVRVIVFPISFIFGLGLIGIITDRRRRALHDFAAHSLVVYDWGERQPRMPSGIQRWLAK